MLTKQFKYHGVTLLCPSKMLWPAASPRCPSSWTRSSLFTLLEDTRKEIRIPDTGTMHTKRRLLTTLYLIFR